VELLWFFLGLAIGLLLLGWHHVQLHKSLHRLLQNWQPDSLSLWQLPTARLIRAIVLQRQPQPDLAQELATWQQILQIAPIGFLQVDEENQLIWCNQQARKLLDIQQTSSRPRLLLELVRSYELDQLIDQTRSARQRCQREWTFHPVCADQSKLSQQQPRPLRASGFPLADEHVGVFLENRQEAVWLVQQRDRWTSDVAHELKTPLTSIRLVTETLQSRVEPPLRTWIDRMLQETIRLSTLVQDLLDLSQLESRNPQLMLKTVDLPKLIQSAWSSLELLARRKSVQLDYHGPASLLIQADEARLHRVMLNLLDNSIKYSPSWQCVRVQLSLHSGADHSQQVYLEVIDAGAGFPESALPYVFDRFYRADPSRSRDNRLPKLQQEDDRPLVMGNPEALVSNGSGLGLAIVRQIVEAHQGSVIAANHPETHGAWLQVFLPHSAIAPETNTNHSHFVV
jgi:two-component system phosphate regulon sensor histidine kinase PhoR